MPLHAIIAGKSVLAFELSPLDWRMLRDRLRADRSLGRLPCCNAPVVAKTSKLGTQFFAHYVRSECTAVNETEAHRVAKRAVYEGCLDAGWCATMEATGPEGTWRADVLATKHRTRIAFEVQLSEQTANRTRERQREFARHQVLGYWLFRRLPFDRLDSQIPAIGLVESPDGSPPSVRLGGRDISLREFVCSVLEEQIRFCSSLSVRRKEARCRIRRISCPHCAASVHFVEATPPPLLSGCGLPLSESGLFPTLRRRYREWANRLASLYGEDVSLSATQRQAAPDFLLRSPPGKSFMTAAGRSGFCPRCLTIIPITAESNQLPVAFEVSTPVPEPGWLSSIGFPHWCVGSNGSYCSAAWHGTAPLLDVASELGEAVQLRQNP